MASSRISALPTASRMTGAETLPVVQDGATKRVKSHALTVVAGGLDSVLAARDTMIDADIPAVELQGYWSAGDGGAARYVRSGTALGAAGSFQSLDGAWWTVVPEGGRTPQMYGAIGDGASHPAGSKYSTLGALQVVYPFATSLQQELDWLGLQASFNTGGVIWSEKRGYVLCNSNPDSQVELTVVSGRVWGSFHGSVFDCSAMRQKTSSTHYAANYNFSNSSSWVNNTGPYLSNQITAAVFGGGQAHCADRTDWATHSQFAEWYQDVVLQPGLYTCVCTYTTTLGVSYASGNANPPYVNIVCAGQVVHAPIGNISSGPATNTVRINFKVTTASTVRMLWQSGGYGDYAVTLFDIVPLLLNAAMLLTRDGASDHYPIPQPLSGFYLTGPGGNAERAGTTGIRMDSFSDIDGTVVAPRDSKVTGFGNGWMGGNGVYLTDMYGMGILSCDKGVYFPTGTRNAGENLRFHGGAIANSGACVDNPGGAEMTFFGTALDYSTQIITNNAGRIELHGLRVETNVDFNVNLPIFHCTVGTIVWHGGFFLGAGSIATRTVPPVSLEQSKAAMMFHGTEIYNLSSAAGYMASGAGMISAPGGWINSGQPNNSVPSAAATHDVFGGAGDFETTGSQFSNADPTGVYIPGCVTSLSGGTYTNRWTSNYISVAPSTEQARSGTRSLKILRGRSDNMALDQVIFMVPVDIINGNASFEMWWKQPTNYGAGTTVVFARVWWGQVIGYDSYARPQMGRPSAWRGDFNISLPNAGSATWTKWGAGSSFMGAPSLDPASNSSLGRPAWATHFVVMLDCQSMASGMSFYLDDMRAFVM